MKELDCIEVIVEKACYAEDGVHKGMQGWICHDVSIDNLWLVNFPQFGEHEDIATIGIDENDMVLLLNGMDARVNERIKAEFEGV